MTEKPWSWPAVIVGSAAAAVAVVLIGWDHPVRSAIVLGFLCVGPGLAVLHPLELPDPVTGLALVVPLSLSIDALVAGALVYAGLWSVPLGIVVVALVTVATLLLETVVLSRERHHREST